MWSANTCMWHGHSQASMWLGQFQANFCLQLNQLSQTLQSQCSMMYGVAKPAYKLFQTPFICSWPSPHGSKPHISKLCIELKPPCMRHVTYAVGQASICTCKDLRPQSTRVSLMKYHVNIDINGIG